MDIIISVEGLRKNFDKVEALKGISFNVERGEIFALLGPNGAGKTTTIKILSCVYKMSGGSATVLGMKIPIDCKKIRERIGVIPQEYQGFMDLTVEENLEYFAGLYRDSLSVEEVIKYFGLEEVKKKKLRYISGGMRRRVGLASAFISKCELLFLDEPTLGLDPKARRDFWNLVKKLKEERELTVFFTTHYLDEAEKFSTRVGILINGYLVSVSTSGELMKEFKKGNLEDAYLELLKSYGEDSEE